MIVAAAGLGTYYLSSRSTVSSSQNRTSSATTEETTSSQASKTSEAFTTTTASTGVQSSCNNTSTLSFNMSVILQKYSEMTLQYTLGNASGGSTVSNFTSIYGYNNLGPVVINGTTFTRLGYEVYEAEGYAVGGALYMKPDGNFSAGYETFEGKTINLTSSEAQRFTGGAVILFGLVTDYGYVSATLLNPSYVHEANTSTVDYGPTSMQVTRYSPNAVPYNLTECGQTATIRSLWVDIGTASGTKIVTGYGISASNIPGGSGLFSGVDTFRLMDIVLASS